MITTYKVNNSSKNENVVIYCGPDLRKKKEEDEDEEGEEERKRYTLYFYLVSSHENEW